MMVATKTAREREFGAILQILHQRLDAVNEAIAALEHMDAAPVQETSIRANRLLMHSCVAA